jgi:hypothetical protein
MAGGALISLVAIGQQDVLITGDATVTFWKQVSRRHTSFALESIEQTVQGGVDFGTRTVVTVSRNGDLMKSAYVEITLPTLPSEYSWVRSAGYRLLNESHLMIGGQIIETVYGEWNEIMHELNTPGDKIDGLNRMVGRDFDGKDMYGRFDPLGGRTSLDRLYVPLNFFFDRSPGLAVPVIAAQYHEIQFAFELASLTDMVRKWDSVANAWTTVSQVPALSGSLGMRVFVDYCFLDTDERRKFATNSHSMLITQTQFHGTDTITTTPADVMHPVRLNLNHPCSMLAWTAGLDPSQTGSLDAFDVDYAPRLAPAVEPRVVRGRVAITELAVLQTYTNDMTAPSALSAALSSSSTYAIELTTGNGGLERLIRKGDHVTAAVFPAGSVVAADPSVFTVNAKDYLKIQFTRVGTAAYSNEKLRITLGANIFPLNTGIAKRDFAIAEGVITAVSGDTVTVVLDNLETVGLIAKDCALIRDDRLVNDIQPADIFEIDDTQQTSSFVSPTTAEPARFSFKMAAATQSTPAHNLVAGERVIFTQPKTIIATMRSTGWTMIEPYKRVVTNVEVPADGSAHLPVLLRNPVRSAMLSLNGHERFTTRAGPYFEHVQPFQHVPRCPRKPIMIYSLGLTPFGEPSGTTNFSRIDSAILQLRMQPPAYGQATEQRRVNIYARNWNLLRFMSGMAGLSFSN